jgi:hypothetical protein
MKISHRFFTSIAIADIIILQRTKRAPSSYTYIGEINGHVICVKYLPIPLLPKGDMPSNKPHNNSTIHPDNRSKSSSPSSPNMEELDKQYVHVEPENTNSTPILAPQHANYNPMQDIPFVINPVYNLTKKDATDELVIHFYLYFNFNCCYFHFY